MVGVKMSYKQISQADDINAVFLGAPVKRGQSPRPIGINEDLAVNTISVCCRILIP